MEDLDLALAAYGQGETYPFHMPGHKRRFPETMNPKLLDITEIEGFDDLHEPGGMIRQIERNLEDLYQVARAHLLVGGSTLGNLVGLLAHLEPGDRLLMARNCHKSIYQGAILGRLSVDYLFPRVLPNGLQGPIQAEAVERALCLAEEAGEKIKLVAITSPTYEGVTSDLAAIGRIAHAHGALVLVDAAHGAHFGLHPCFPPSAADAGADLVVAGLHKTLPFYTMTSALLLPRGSGADAEAVTEMIDRLETSSPSYILMGQAAAALRFLREEGPAYFKAYAGELRDFYRDCEKLKVLGLLRTDDPGKIVISCAGAPIRGQALMDCLRRDYRLELEMASFDYVLAMTSLMDTREGFRRLREALFAIDASLAAREGAGRESRAGRGERLRDLACERPDDTVVYGRQRKVLEPWQAVRAKTRCLPLAEAAGLVSRDSVILYPPGIPLVHSGEEITQELISYICQAQEEGLRVQGLREGEIRVLVRR